MNKVNFLIFIVMMRHILRVPRFKYVLGLALSTNQCISVPFRLLHFLFGGGHIVLLYSNGLSLSLYVVQADLPLSPEHWD